MQFHPFISNLLPWRQRRIARFEKDTGRQPACAQSAELDVQRYVDESIRWLLRAQQVTGNGGLSEGYNIRLGSWGPAYAETTGYAIPSLLAAARVFPKWEAPLTAACMEMGYWLKRVQLPSGAIGSGNQNHRSNSPSVFNCGQVLQGFHALLPHNEHFDKPARAAAEWMCAMQDNDGAWRKGVSALVRSGHHAYYVRAAWALGAYGNYVGSEKYVRAAQKNARFVLEQATQNWFSRMSFDDDDSPLLHTVAYTLEGLLELSVLFQEPAWFDAVTWAAEKIALLQNPITGALPGKLKAPYLAASDWTTTTGNAQMAVIWYRLTELSGDTKWLPFANQAIGFNCRLQDMSSHHPNYRGGLIGCHPYSAGYGAYWFMNWNVKFQLDALLLNRRIYSVV